MSLLKFSNLLNGSSRKEYLYNDKEYDINDINKSNKNIKTNQVVITSSKTPKSSQIKEFSKKENKQDRDSEELSPFQNIRDNNFKITPQTLSDKKSSTNKIKNSFKAQVDYKPLIDSTSNSSLTNKNKGRPFYSLGFNEIASSLKQKINFGTKKEKLEPDIDMPSNINNTNSLSKSGSKNNPLAQSTDKSNESKLENRNNSTNKIYQKGK